MRSPGKGIHRHIRANCQMGAAILQGRFKFLDEQPLAADFGQWFVGIWSPRVVMPSSVTARPEVTLSVRPWRDGLGRVPAGSRE